MNQATFQLLIALESAASFTGFNTSYSTIRLKIPPFVSCDVPTSQRDFYKMLDCCFSTFLGFKYLRSSF